MGTPRAVRNGVDRSVGDPAPRGRATDAPGTVAEAARRRAEDVVDYAADDNHFEDDGQGGGLRGRVMRSGFWSTGGYVVQNVVRLGSNLILSRLLLPDQFGLMVLVNIFMQGLQMFSDVGIGPSIIHNKRGKESGFLDTAYTIQVVRGLALFVVACGLAYPMAAVFETPELFWAIPVAGLSAIVLGFTHTALFTRNRDLDLSRITILQLIQQGLMAGGMIAWALLISADFWALLVPGIFANLAYVVGTHVWLGGDRRRFRLDRSAAGELFSYGRWIFFSTLLTFVANQADRLIFGKLFDLTLLGIYGIGLMIAVLPREMIGKLGTYVIFPTYSKVRDDPERFGKIYKQVRLTILAAGALVTSIFIGIGEPLIRFLYTEPWHAAGWMLQLLAIGAWFQIMQAPNQAVLLALGKPNWMAAANAVKAVSLVIGVLAGYAWGAAQVVDPQAADAWVYPFVGALGGVVISDLLHYAVSALAVRVQKLPGLSVDPLMTLCVAVTSGAAWWVTHLVSAAWLGLVLGLLTLMAVWLPIVFWQLHRQRISLRELTVSDLKRMVGR